MRFERLPGLISTLFYVFAGDAYLGVVSEVAEGHWLAANPAAEPLPETFASCESAGRGLAAPVCGTAARSSGAPSEGLVARPRVHARLAPATLH